MCLPLGGGRFRPPFPAGIIILAGGGRFPEGGNGPPGGPGFPGRFKKRRQGRGAKLTPRKRRETAARGGTPKGWNGDDDKFKKGRRGNGTPPGRGRSGDGQKKTGTWEPKGRSGPGTKGQPTPGPQSGAGEERKSGGKQQSQKNTKAGGGALRGGKNGHMGLAGRVKNNGAWAGESAGNPSCGRKNNLGAKPMGTKKGANPVGTKPKIGLSGNRGEGERDSNSVGFGDLPR